MGNKKHGLILAKNTPCIDMFNGIRRCAFTFSVDNLRIDKSSKDMSQQSICPLLGELLTFHCHSEASNSLRSFAIAQDDKGLKQLVCPLSGGSARRAKGVRKVAFTKPSRATSECNERETDNYARMNILANWRRWRLEGSEQRVKGVKPYPFIASCLKRGAVAFTFAEDNPRIDNEMAGLLRPDGLAMTKAPCHCEERSDEAIPKKVAFTLAEVLITLAIIGVVAAITVPGLVTKINDKVKNTRITTIEKKLHQGTDKLMVLGHINGYNTTEEFVQALSEHMKISTYCSADRIADCFPYDKINVDGGTATVNVADLKTPEAFGLDGEKYSNPVSFITGDGTPYIISYKKDCDIDDGNGRANSAACIAGIYDWNGARVPNKFATETKSGTTDEKVATGDIMFLGNVTKLAGKKVVQTDGDLSPAITSGSKTYTKFKLVANGGLDYCGEDGTETCAWQDGKGLKTCSESGNGMGGGYPAHCNDNKWYAAVKKCESLGLELPDKYALLKVSQQKTSNPALNARLTAENAKYDYFWSLSPDDSWYAYGVGFSTDYTGRFEVYYHNKVICLGE